MLAEPRIPILDEVADDGRQGSVSLIEPRGVRYNAGGLGGVSERSKEAVLKTPGAPALGVESFALGHARHGESPSYPTS